MYTVDTTPIITTAVEALSSVASLEGLSHQHRSGHPLPSGQILKEIIEISRSILFPGFYGAPLIDMGTLPYHLGVSVQRLYELLCDQIYAGLCFGNSDLPQRERAEEYASHIISCLPELRRVLSTDVHANYDGDPAALVLPCHQGTGELSSGSRDTPAWRAPHPSYDDRDGP